MGQAGGAGGAGVAVGGGVGRAAVVEAGVTGYCFTTGREHDRKRFDELVKDEYLVVDADSAYTIEDRRAGRRVRGVHLAGDE